MTDSKPQQTAAHRIWALVPCAGNGSRAAASRAGGDLPKQYQLVAGRPLVLHTLNTLLRVTQVHAVLAVVAPTDTDLASITHGLERFSLHHGGGATRAHSVLNGLKALAGQGAAPRDWVLVHDAARCLVTPQQISQLIEACRHHPVGGLLALPLPDTLKQERGGMSQQTLPRTGKWLAQTPQMFRLGALTQALEAAMASDPTAVTDEASAMEAGNLPTAQAGAASALGPLLVHGSAQNFKVTYPEDFELAESILRSRSLNPQPTPPNFPHPNPGAMRIGEGWDIHALVAGRPLVLGGVAIPFHLGLQGHSDADALLHAITDAILGAAALGDIGQHFPDTDALFQAADSAKLLAEAARRVRAAGWEIGNIDCTVVAQAPKLAPHMLAMRASIAGVLGVNLAQINVKAKTAEKMGPVGLGQAMEARAVALLFSSPAVLPQQSKQPNIPKIIP